MVGLSPNSINRCTMNNAFLALFPFGKGTWNADVSGSGPLHAWGVIIRLLRTNGATISTNELGNSPESGHWSKSFDFPVNVYHNIRNVDATRHCLGGSNF